MLVERAAAVGFAGCGLLIGLQTVPILLEQQATLHRPLAFTVGAVLLGCLIWVAILAVRRRSVRVPAATLSVVFLVALAAWPLMVRDPLASGSSTPWLWYLCNVATAAAAIAFSTPAATGYTIFVPVLYGAVRITPAGGSASLESTIFDVVYALVLGGVLLVLITMVRSAASDVDIAQSAAVARYAEVVGEHAREVERVGVDALVHDSVLTTFLGAAAAESAEQRRFATTMAERAICLLTGITEDERKPADPVARMIGIVVLGRRIRESAAALARPFAVSVAGDRGITVPESVAEALVAAAVQAMTNSVQHAGDGATGRVEVHGRPGSVAVSVVDDGIGFEVDSVSERIGMRVSIRERVALAGGSATIDSAPGQGTRVQLCWPDTDPITEAAGNFRFDIPVEQAP